VPYSRVTTLQQRFAWIRCSCVPRRFFGDMPLKQYFVCQVHPLAVIMSTMKLLQLELKFHYEQTRVPLGALCILQEYAYPICEPLLCSTGRIWAAGDLCGGRCGELSWKSVSNWKLCRKVLHTFSFQQRIYGNYKQYDEITFVKNNI